MAAGLLVAAAFAVTNAEAQSVDALLDKLVEKGILTTKEAKTLREESDKNFTKAYSAKTGMPEWVTSMTWKGDIRLRYDHIESDNADQMSRGRYRFRFRYGAEAALTEGFAAGFRLASGDTDPLSTNQSLTDNGTKKAVNLDTVYARWKAINNSDLSVEFTGGKMENIFVGKNLKFSDSVFDTDYTPEGVAVESVWKITPQQNLALGFGAFILSETNLTQDEATLLVYRAQLNSVWSPHISTSVGLGGYALDNAPLVTGGVSSNTGNTSGQTFTPVVADASATYLLESFPMYSGAFPITVAGEYIVNPQSPANERTGWSAGITFGKSGKKGLWDLSYRYKDLQKNAVWDDITDSDFGSATASTANSHSYVTGPGSRGHIFQGQYNFTDAVSTSLKWFWTESSVLATAQLDTHRVQLDFSWKF